MTVKDYETEACSHCGRHSRVDTEWCLWCFRPYSPRVIWWEALKLAAVIAFGILVIAMVFGS